MGNSVAKADVRGVAGTWNDLTESVNFMAGNLTAQVRNIAEVTTAVASGDLSKKITVDVRGEILDLNTPSIRWSISCVCLHPKSRVCPGKLAAKENSVDKRMCGALRARGKT